MSVAVGLHAGWSYSPVGGSMRRSRVIDKALGIKILQAAAASTHGLCGPCPELVCVVSLFVMDVGCQSRNERVASTLVQSPSTLSATCLLIQVCGCLWPSARFCQSEYPRAPLRVVERASSTVDFSDGSSRNKFGGLHPGASRTKRQESSTFLLCARQSSLGKSCLPLTLASTKAMMVRLSIA